MRETDSCRIIIREIEEFVGAVPYITDLQRTFYKRYIAARYKKIILSAYEHIHYMSLGESAIIR